MFHSIKRIIPLFNVHRKFTSLVLEAEKMALKNQPYDKSSIVWMDMEMTGLEVERDKILEVACIVTDAQLNILEKCPTLIIHQPNDVLNNMNEWCMTNHKKTGLIEDCQKSALSLEEAQQTLYEFLIRNVPKGQCPLAGNSVYMDRLFLRKYMPQVNNYLHYRIIDVSTLKELFNRWNKNIYSNAPKKKLGHRALDDVLESIEELRYYKNFLQVNCS